MARVRMEEPDVKLETWDDVDLCLKEIGECQLEIEGIEAKLTNDTNDLKMQAEDDAKPHKERIAELERQIKGFTEENRVELKDKRTKVLNFGNVGFRRSTKITLTKVANVIAALKQTGRTKYIKVKESVDRNKLAELSDDELLDVGAKRNTSDTFWYEFDREKLMA